MVRRFALVERDDEGESSSEADDPLSDLDEDLQGPTADETSQPQGARTRTPGGAPKLKLSLGKKKDQCKVCGATDHRAGFVGATYHDCPNRPCYLCKQPGHTTATCPFKVAPGHGCSPSPSASRTANLLSALRGREDGSRGRVPAAKMPPTPTYQVDAAIYKVHTRRCCTLEFHPGRDNLVISGDKKGGIAIWNFDSVHDRTIYTDIHTALCNQIKVLPWLDSQSAATASSDGTVKLFDLETGVARELLDINPLGWVPGGPWNMVYGCAANAHLQCLYAGDSIGRLHVLDPRAPFRSACTMSVQLHKKDKIVSVDSHPLEPSLILTAGNDRNAKISDVRCFSSNGSSSSADAGASATAAAGPGSQPAGQVGGAGPSNGAGRGSGASSSKGAALNNAAARAEVASMAHPKVINAAYFSPVTGRKVLTTCQDNRLRVWDSLLSCGGPASREIVHSHDFNRYLTPFKAEWDPKDPTENRFIIGRYISEDINGRALHPIDILDASSGALLRELIDTNLTTITPVNKMHPRRDVIISGSSRSLYMWAPSQQEDEEGGLGVAGPSTPAAEQRGAEAAALEALRRASARFTFFDADPGGSGEKKKGGSGKRKGATSEATDTSTKARRPADDDDDDD